MRKPAMTIKNHRLSKNWTVEAHRMADGTPIRYGLFRRIENINRLLVFVNGRSEWIEKYAFLPEALGLPENCGFLTFDHRGQGASGGKRGDIESYQHYTEDLAAIIKHAGQNLPYSLVAHSMGSLISLYATLEHQIQPESLVLSSPLFGFNEKGIMPKIYRPLFAMLQDSPMGTLPVPMRQDTKQNFENNPYTHDAQNFAELANAPYRVPAPSIRWVTASVSAIESIHTKRLIKKLSCPVLALSGTKDSIVDIRAIANWVRLATKHSPKEISFRRTTGAKHELFNEIKSLRQTSILSTRYFMKEVWN